MRSGPEVNARGRRGVVLMVLVLALAGCARREHVYGGVQYSADGKRLMLASHGACGCVTQNKTNRPLTLVATLHAGPTGSMILAPEDIQRVRFDWAGPDGDDLYEIVAVDPESEILLTPLSDYVAFAGTDESGCGDASCSFQSLNMNRAAAAPIGQDAVQAHQRGVNYTRAIKCSRSLPLGAAVAACCCATMVTSRSP